MTESPLSPEDLNGSFTEVTVWSVELTAEDLQAVREAIRRGECALTVRPDHVVQHGGCLVGNNFDKVER